MSAIAAAKSARAHLAAAGRYESALTLEHQKHRGNARLELSLFTRVLLFGGLSGDDGGVITHTGGMPAFKGVADIRLDKHLTLISHGLKAPYIGSRGGGIRRGLAVSPRQ